MSSKGGWGGTLSSSEFGTNSFLVFPPPFLAEKRPLCKTQRQQNPFVKSQETSDKYGSKAKELSWQLLADCSKLTIHREDKDGRRVRVSEGEKCPNEDRQNWLVPAFGFCLRLAPGLSSSVPYYSQKCCQNPFCPSIRVMPKGPANGGWAAFGSKAVTVKVVVPLPCSGKSCLYLDPSQPSVCPQSWAVLSFSLPPLRTTVDEQLS